MKGHRWITMKELQHSEEELCTMRIDYSTGKVLVAPASHKWMRYIYNLVHNVKQRFNEMVN